MSPAFRSSPLVHVCDQRSLCLVAIILSTLLTAACGESTASGQPLRVTSSIADGTLLTVPVPWIATVTGIKASDPLNHVDFNIDGAVAWTERNAPYTFNDDGYLLVNAVLPPGSHVLAIDAVTTSGAHATTSAKVTTTRPPVPVELLAKGFVQFKPADAPAPAGIWRIEFDADGVIRIDDPGGGKATEAFIATSDGGLTLYGPTNWIVPESDRNGFCDEPENIATMQWQVRGSDLVMSARGGSDNCDGRRSFFGGTWKVKP
jgi:hypothetical protein